MNVGLYLTALVQNTIESIKKGFFLLSDVKNCFTRDEDGSA